MGKMMRMENFVHGHRRVLPALALFSLLGLAACNEAYGTEQWDGAYPHEADINRPKGGDAGPRDGGAADSGPKDAGGTDASALDAGGMTDAGGATDAGTTTDTGAASDADAALDGGADAGNQDASALIDAGQRD